MKVFRVGGIARQEKVYNTQIDLTKSAYNQKLIKIPVGMAKYVYEMYKKEYKNDQSFEEMDERGGFGVEETIYYLWAKILELETQVGVAVDFVVPKELQDEFWEYMKK